MPNPSKWIACCSLAVLIALYVVGAVSHGSLRHEVQTLPLWIPIVLGFRRSQFAKWAALPCFLFWLAIMILIWLFLLGWTHIVRGHFSPIEDRDDVGHRHCLLLWDDCLSPLAYRNTAAGRSGGLPSVRSISALCFSAQPHSIHRVAVAASQNLLKKAS